MFGRRKIAALVAEFLGTGALTLLLLSVQRSTIGVPFFVAAAAGLTISLMTFAVYRVSGAQFNPALTIALFTARKLTIVRTVMFVIAQFLGAYVAYLLYSYFVKNKLQRIGVDFSVRILVAEFLGAFVFSFGYASALYQRLSLGTAAAVGGLAYMIGSVAASPASLGLINPAIAIGVKAWVLGTYILGPVLGAIVGVNLYGLLFADREPRLVVANKTARISPVEPIVVAKPGRKPRATTSKVVAAKPVVATKRVVRKK